MAKRVTVDTSELDKKLKDVEDAARHQKMEMGKIARDLEKFVRNTFRDATDPWGVPWPELKPSTLAGRKREGLGVAPLIAHGDMFDSIKPGSDETTAWVEMGEGLPDPRAPVQQFGNPSNRAWGGPIAPIPARPMFPLRHPDEESFPQEWLDTVFNPIEGVLLRAVK